MWGLVVETLYNLVMRRIDLWFLWRIFPAICWMPLEKLALNLWERRWGTAGQHLTSGKRSAELCVSLKGISQVEFSTEKWSVQQLISNFMAMTLVKSYHLQDWWQKWHDSVFITHSRFEQKISHCSSLQSIKHQWLCPNYLYSSFSSMPPSALVGWSANDSKHSICIVCQSQQMFTSSRLIPHPC